MTQPLNYSCIDKSWFNSFHNHNIGWVVSPKCYKLWRMGHSAAMVTSLPCAPRHCGSVVRPDDLIASKSGGAETAVCENTFLWWDRQIAQACSFRWIQCQKKAHSRWEQHMSDLTNEIEVKSMVVVFIFACFSAKMEFDFEAFRCRSTLIGQFCFNILRIMEW